VDLEPRGVGQPVADLDPLVGRVIVHDQSNSTGHDKGRRDAERVPVYAFLDVGGEHDLAGPPWELRRGGHRCGHRLINRRRNFAKSSG